MRLELSEHAVAQLVMIWDYYAAEANFLVADRIVEGVLTGIGRLADHPRGGQYEPMLDHLGLGHRRVISGHYKIIYRLIDDLVFITDVFDSRQDPDKMAW